MCGIVGAIAQRDVAEILLEGLRRLEYRGYDSAGLAVVDAEGHMTRLRRLGKVQMLAQAAEEHPLHGGTGIAHTRWATHGEPSEVNAHPHVSEHIVVVHNGIIENHEPLREELKARGYTFVSETDTEVIAHLVNWELKQGGTLREAVLRAIPQLRGAYGTVIMDSRHPDTLLAARSGSPLVIGLGMGENFIASDQLALIDADMPVIVVAPNNELLEKLKSNIEEVRARGGQLYVFADQDAGFVSSDNMHIIEMPHVEEVIAPIFYTVPLQLLAYHVALIKGTDVDQPRNLAKSVTVE